MVSLPTVPNFTNTLIATNNKIQKLPQTQTQKKFDEIYLSGNPFDCNCQMTWMITWLNNQSGIVKDYRQIKCGNGRFKDIPVHVLTDVALGCFPHTWSTAQKAGVAVGIVVIITAFVVVMIIMRRSREVKFLMYYYMRLDTVPSDDKTEMIEDKEFDAFFCYW